MKAVRHRTNTFTPKGTRYALAGEYRFKGVASSQIIYTVGVSIESLQPPPGNDKVTRLGGAKRIKSRLRDKELKELFFWIINRTAFIFACYAISVLVPIVIDKRLRMINELDSLFYWVDDLLKILEPFLELIGGL